MAEKFPAPRETDCAYGCCKAGEVGVSSEAVARHAAGRAGLTLGKMPNSQAVIELVESTLPPAPESYSAEPLTPDVLDEAVQNMSDMSLYGNRYETADGTRIDPARVHFGVDMGRDDPAITLYTISTLTDMRSLVPSALMRDRYLEQARKLAIQRALRARGPWWQTPLAWALTAYAVWKAVRR